MVHQDCRLSERRFDFHDMRVSGEKTALVQIATLRALDPRARISSEHHEAFGEVSMLPWTTREISLLIGLWPTASATKISKRLNRSRGSVCGKVMRLRSDGVLPADVEKHFKVHPAVQMRPDPIGATVTSIRTAKPMPPIDGTVPPPEMRCCSLIELDDGQCRWPLGDVHRVATQFCGGDAVPGFPYCRHHWRMACG